MKITKIIRDNKNFMLLAVTIIFFGAISAFWVGRSADSQLRKELLHQARLVAPAINIDRIKTLRGSEEDLTSSYYSSLKHDFAAIRSTDPQIRFIYLLGLNDKNEIFFYVDNEPTDSKDYSPPGQIFEDASEELRDIFNTRTAFVEGPDPDAWGVWVSTLVPVTDPDTGKVIAVMGMDIDAKDWKLNVASRAAIPVLMVLIIVSMLLMWTNKRRIAVKLKENEEKYRRFFDTSLDCTFITSKDGTIIDANDVSLSLFGYSNREDLFKTNIVNLYANAGDREVFINVLQEKGYAKEHPVELRKKDGTILHCTVTAILLKGHDNEITGIQGTVRDISEKKMHEEQLQQREATLTAITNSAQDAIMMIDPEGNVSFWNPAAEKILGWNHAEAIGKNLHSIVAPSRFHGAHKKAFPGFLATGQGSVVGKTIELMALRKDGIEIPVELSLSAVNIQNSWHAVGIMRDISERKASENEIRATNEKLSTMVEELESKNIRAKMTSELREYLSACQTVIETGPVIQKYLKKFFPGSDGALFLLSPSKNDLESIARWGNYSDDPMENCLSPDECWGLRRGINYIIANCETDVPCSHIKNPETGVLYACFPLIAKNETIGLLHIRCLHYSSFNDEKRSFFKETSETLVALLSLAISNIKLTEKLNMLSIKDPLTGLFNRRYLEETFIREAIRAKRKQASIGVIMVDIDHFKKFNDVFGHAAGDLVLSELAKFFSSGLRGCDIVCRYGGEEFALILPDANIENTFARAQQLVEKARDIRIHFSGQALGQITLSMGVSAYPVHGEKLEEILKTADIALYRAKQTGRDRVVMAETVS